jgi:hypothetical protein
MVVQGSFPKNKNNPIIPNLVKTEDADEDFLQKLEGLTC